MVDSVGPPSNTRNTIENEQELQSAKAVVPFLACLAVIVLFDRMIKYSLSENDYNSLAERGTTVVKVVGGALMLCIVASNLRCLCVQSRSCCKRNPRQIKSKAREI